MENFNYIFFLLSISILYELKNHTYIPKIFFNTFFLISSNKDFRHAEKVGNRQHHYIKDEKTGLTKRFFVTLLLHT